MLSGIAVTLEFPVALLADARGTLEQLDLLSRIPLLPLLLFQLRFVVEKIDMTRGAGHEELDHALGPSRMMRSRQGTITCEQVRQG